MSEWNPNMDEAPERRDIWFTFRKNGELRVCRTTIADARGSQLDLIAWKHPEERPKPYKSPKPEQHDVGEFITPCGDKSASVHTIIRKVEERTREIVAWEQEHGDE